jgi:hypothetical protein
MACPMFRTHVRLDLPRKKKSCKYHKQNKILLESKNRKHSLDSFTSFVHTAAEYNTELDYCLFSD